MRWRAMKSTRRRLVPTIISAIYILLVPTIALVGSAPAPCVPTVRFCTLTAATDGAHKCASVLLMLPPMAHTSVRLYSYCCHRWRTQVRFCTLTAATDGSHKSPVSRSAATDGSHKCAAVLLLLPPMAHTSALLVRVTFDAGSYRQPHTSGTRRYAP